MKGNPKQRASCHNTTHGKMGQNFDVVDHHHGSTTFSHQVSRFLPLAIGGWQGTRSVNVNLSKINEERDLYGSV